MKIDVEESVNIKLEDYVPTPGQSLSCASLRSRICTWLRRVIEQCWHQLAISPKLTLDDHHQFLRTVEERLRRILALLELETGNDCSPSGVAHDPLDGDVVGDVNIDADEEENDHRDDDDDSWTGGGIIIGCYDENDVDPIFHGDGNRGSGSDSTAWSMPSDVTASSALVTPGGTRAQTRLPDNGVATRKGSALPVRNDDVTDDVDGHDDRDFDDGDGDDDDHYHDHRYLPLSERKRNGGKKTARNSVVCLDVERKPEKRRKKRKNVDKAPSPLELGDKNSESISSKVVEPRFELMEAPPKEKAALSLRQSPTKPSQRDENLLRRLLLASFCDVYSCHATEKKEKIRFDDGLGRDTRAKGGCPSGDAVDVNCASESTAGTYGDAVSASAEMIECRVCDAVITPRQLLSHHAGHADRERRWRMTNRRGKRVRKMADCQRVPCPWCGDLFVDDRHLGASSSETSLREPVLEDSLAVVVRSPTGEGTHPEREENPILRYNGMSTEVTAFSSPDAVCLPSAETNYLCHIFERHQNVTLRDMKVHGIDADVAVPSEGGVFALDFSERSCHCLRCFYKCDSLTELKPHVEKKHARSDDHDNVIGDDDSNVCRVCDKLFESITRLKRHQRMVHREKKIPCEVCGKMFQDAHKAKRHREIVHLNVKRTCEICGKTYSHIENLRRHQRMVHEEGPKKTFPCDTCGKAYTSLPSLHYHKTSLHLRRRYACRLCDASYYQRRRLNDHVQRVHEGVVKQETCPLCGRHFTEKGSLKKHLESTHGSKKHPCATCGKEFARASGLHAHVTSAHLGKRYQCDQCSKSFTQSGTLAAHKRNHHELL